MKDFEPEDRSIQIPTEIHLSLNQALTQYCKFQRIENNYIYGVNNSTSIILDSSAIAQLINQSILQIKIFDRQMQNIINEITIDNMKNLRGLNIMINRQLDQAIIVCIHPTNQKHIKQLILYGNQIDGEIKARITAKFTCQQEILKISDAYHLSSSREYFWVITTQFGKILLLSYKYDQLEDKINLIDITEESAMNSLLQTFMKPFRPPKHPYNSCKIFFYPFKQQDLYTFILFDFQLQMRFLALNNITQISKLAQWQLDLAKIIPRQATQIMHAQIKCIDTTKPNQITFIFACYEQDPFNQFQHYISLYLMKIDIHSNKQSKIVGSYKNIITLSQNSINRVGFKSSENKLWILYCHQEQNNCYRNYLLKEIDLGCTDYKEGLLEENFVLKENAILLGLDYYGVCLLLETSLQALEKLPQSQQVIGQLEKYSAKSHHQKSENSNKMNSESYNHKMYTNPQVQEMKKFTQTNKKTQRPNKIIYKAIKDYDSETLRDQLNKEEEIMMEGIIKLKQNGGQLGFQQCVMSISKSILSSIFSSFYFDPQLVFSYFVQKFENQDAQDSLTKLIIKKQPQYIKRLFALLYDGKQWLILCHVSMKFATILQQLISPLNQDKLIKNVKQNYMGYFYKALQQISLYNGQQMNVNQEQLKQQMLLSYIKISELVNSDSNKNIEDLCKKFNLQLLKKIAMRLKNRMIFLYILSQNHEFNIIQEYQFIQFIDRCYEQDEDFNSSVHFIQECLNEQIQRKEPLSILIWINSSRYKEKYFQKIFDFLVQVKPAIVPVYLLLAEKPERLHELKKYREFKYSDSQSGSTLNKILNNV